MNLRHTYSHPSKKTPFYFRFSVSSNVFKAAGRMGRPQGVFKADCWGHSLVVDPQGRANDKPLVDYAHEPWSAGRFPHATAFTSLQDAALECDFWKFVLLKRYYLEIPFSHGSLAEYLDAARMALQEPYQRLADEDRWSLELLDFISLHRDKLQQHREVNKPEVDLDGFEEWAKTHNNRELRVWVECVREAQKDLEQFKASTPDSLVDRVQTLHKYLSSIRDARMPVCPSDSPVSRDVVELTHLIQGADAARVKAAALLCKVDAERIRLQASLDKLLANRPST